MNPPRGLIQFPERAQSQIDLALARAAEMGGDEAAVNFCWSAYIDEPSRVLLAWRAFQAAAQKQGK